MGAASMGPRRCRRGRRGLRPAFSGHRAPASMGPRRCRRGRPGRSGASAIDRFTIATAASMGPRRCRRGRPRGTLGCTRAKATGFNGAAAMSPRKTAAGIHSDYRCLRLQWGRGDVAAEDSVASVKPRTRPWASMGPRRCRRGRRNRDCSIGTAGACFNGAAAMSPRKTMV